MKRIKQRKAVRLLTLSGGIAAILCSTLSLLPVHAADNPGPAAKPPGLATRTLTVSGAWARATMPGQSVGAVYMKIASPLHTTLTRVESDVAASTELHSMRMQDGVMQMRALKQLEIPAGKETELVSGGTHLMLIGLKRPLKAGETIRLKMAFANEVQGKTTLLLDVPVRPFAE